MSRLDQMTDKQRKFLLRSCAMKRRYPIEPPLPDMTWRAYPCGFCNGWHLTRKRLDSIGGPETFSLNPDWIDR